MYGPSGPSAQLPDQNRRATEKAAVDARPDAAEYVDDGIDIAESDPFFCRQFQLQPIRCSAKKVDQRRCQVLGWELWRARYRNRGQIAVGRSIV